MPSEHKHSSRLTASHADDARVYDGNESLDLHGACFAVGGGDLRIVELIQEARRQGYEVEERVYRRRPEQEGSTFRPPGFETQE